MKRIPNEELSAKQILDAAYSFLSRRPYSRIELQEKLARKGFCPDIIESILNKLCQQGYLNDEETSFRWAQSLVQERLWGKAKITFYLLQKGISKNIIDKVQKKIWQEFSEKETAEKAIKKRFPPLKKLPSQGKLVAFLKTRGFSSEVIYKVVRDFMGDKIIE